METSFQETSNGYPANPIISDTAIGAVIRERRHELGLTLVDLAGRLGVTGQQVQRYEFGRNSLNVENIQRISRALDVPVSFFFRPGCRASSPKLNPAERMLLERFRLVGNDEVRELVNRVVHMAANAGTGQTQHDA